MDHEQIADALWAAQQEGRHMPAEWRGRLSAADGYPVQLAMLARRIAHGERQAGWKVGLTAAAMRRQWNIHEPCFGYLLDSGAHASGRIYRYDALQKPGFENELCLTIGRTLRGPGVTLDDAAAAVSHAAPALEIVENRGPFADDMPLTLADNAQQYAFVTGAPVLLTGGNRDLARAHVDVDIDSRRADSAPGSAVMDGGGLLSIVWLANKLAEFGRPLEAGMRVMAGSFTRQYAAAPGMRIRATFTPFGVVEAGFD
ncbi:MAG: 2-keto-4-pentenoate hydratase [Lautropia sp.]